MKEKQGKKISKNLLGTKAKFIYAKYIPFLHAIVIISQEKKSTCEIFNIIFSEIYYSPFAIIRLIELYDYMSQLSVTLIYHF